MIERLRVRYWQDQKLFFRIINGCHDYCTHDKSDLEQTAKVLWSDVEQVLKKYAKMSFIILGPGFIFYQRFFGLKLIMCKDIY